MQYFLPPAQKRYSSAIVSPSKPREAQRIAKLLARAGIASRREIERMIAEGRIALDGKVLDTPATIVTSLHGITVDGKPVREPAPARLFLFHKPPGLLTAATDPKGRPTIYDKLPSDLPRLMPVGRLDLNTEGLLLMTTDGELKRQLELPATGVERSYRARAYGEVSQPQLEALMDGIEIDGIRYGAIDANLERRTGANVWIEMTLTEGKNREVRRVLEHLGLQVSRLIRTRYGPFVLGELPVGEIGEVRQHDLVAFRKTLSLPPAQRANAIIALRTEGAAAKPRPARPAREEAPAAREPDAPRSKARPARGRPASEGPAKPKRAARARAHRETQEEFVERPKPSARRGPAKPRTGEQPERPAQPQRRGPARPRSPEQSDRPATPSRRGPGRPGTGGKRPPRPPRTRK